MEKPDWVLWDDAERSVTLEECVCLSLDADPHQKPKAMPAPASPAAPATHPSSELKAAPVLVYSGDHLTSQERNEMLERTHEVLRTPKGQERLTKLRHHFDQGSRMLPSQGRPDYYGAYAEKRVKLINFVRWAHAMKWDVPEPLQISPTPAPATTTPAPTDPDTSSNVKPWEVADPSDPAPAQSWYTPARYFARQLVVSDSTLLIKKLVLADKVSKSLVNAGIYKRGGKKPHDAATVQKALVKVKLG